MGFIEEYQALKKKFPRRSQIAISSENCDWGNHLFECRNCYYCFDSTQANECIHTYDSFKVTGCIDVNWSAFCERCLDTLDSFESTDCVYSQYLAQCYNMWYSINCGSCHDCFGCFNLGNRSYCIFNIQYTEEEYNAKLPELKKMPSDQILAKVREIEKKFPRIQSYFSSNNNSDYVDYVYKSNNSYYCFDSNSLDGCLYTTISNECSASAEALYALKTDNSIEVTDTNECYNCYEAQDCNRCYDSSFIYNCDDCHNCFGCVSLQNKQYCILNVQYSKEGYEQKVAEIKKQMGLFYPIKTTG